ncbi:MAG: SPOR domain-containing protein [Guyparkeria sp.]
MTEATEHALEQAERIVQYAKYSDRFMVVEGDSAAERRAFVKLVGQKLPRQVRPVVLRPDGGNDSAALIDQLSTLLQLSAGIETIDQLVTAATAALEGQERLLIVVENADQWLASDAADALYDLITQSHDLARERILFLLVGANGLCEQAETAQPLAGLVADLHCARLFGGTQPAAVSATPTTDSTAGAANASATDSAPPPPSSAAATTRERTARSVWTSPTLLIAAVISVAVIAIGIFALLSRSSDPTPPEPAPVQEESSESNGESGETEDQRRDGRPEDRPSDDESGDEPSIGDAEEEAEDQPTDEESGDKRPDLSEPQSDGAGEDPEVDHGRPPHVPFPEASDDVSATEDDSSSDEDTQSSDNGEKTDSAVSEDETPPSAEEEEGPESAADGASDGIDNDWFREQPRARAAIQLAAFGKLGGAEAMIDRYASETHPREEWRIYTQSISGKVLYTVTFGDFASTERAAHAIDSLPDELRELKPYPRSVGAIQDRLTDASD